MQRILFTRLLFPAFLVARSLGGAEPDAVVTRVTPVIIPVSAGAIQNAGAGTEIWHGGPADGMVELVRYAVRISDHALNSMIRVGWDACESGEGEYHFERMDRHFAYGLQYGQKLNIGCFVTSHAGTAQKIDGASCCYPAYVHEAMRRGAHKDVVNKLWLSGKESWEPNFESPYLLARYDALLGAFAEYLEKPIAFGGRAVPRKRLVRCIEMRHFGFWGEGAYSKHLIPSNSACLMRFADLFIRHFPGIRIVVPTNGMVYIPSVYDRLKEYHFHLLSLRNDAGPVGIFRDNWGCDESSDYYQRLYHAANLYEKGGVRLHELLRDRWKIAPLVGEPGRWGPTGKGFHPYWGLIEQVCALRPAVIRNCNVSTGRHATNPTDYSILDDPRALDAFHRMYAIIGFRYLFTEARVRRAGRETAIEIDWRNIGLTPTYDAWRVRYLVEDAAGGEIWSRDSTLDLRSIFPAADAPPGAVSAGGAHTHVDRFDDLPAGGDLHVQIVDPAGISPPMALSIEGRTARGAYALAPRGQ